MDSNFNINGTCYPSDRFSSYEEYVKHLKDKRFAFDAPDVINKIESL